EEEGLRFPTLQNAWRTLELTYSWLKKCEILVAQVHYLQPRGGKTITNRHKPTLNSTNSRNSNPVVYIQIRSLFDQIGHTHCDKTLPCISNTPPLLPKITHYSARKEETQSKIATP